MSTPILLVVPPCPDGPPMYYGPPYGIALIAACLEQRGHEVLCRDFERESGQAMWRECRKLVAERGVGLVGIGGSSASRSHMHELARQLRGHFPELTIVLGGAYATPLADLLLRSLPIDYVVLGDGEQTLPELAACLDGEGDPRQVAGLALRRGDDVVRTDERPRLGEVDQLPYPAFHLFGVERELQRHDDVLATELGQRRLQSIKGKRCSTNPTGLMVLSSFGCVHRCAFCPMSQAQRPRYRAHSPAYFVDLVAELRARYGLDHFIFGDNLFTQDRTRTLAICDELCRRGLGEQLEWMCMTRTDCVDAELLGRMRQAGCVEIVFGVESCAESIQQAVHKKLDLQSVAPALAGCEQAGIRSIMSLMVGNPGESEQTVLETLCAVRDLEPDEAQVKITKIYPGTLLHERAVEAGVIGPEHYLEPEEQPPPYTVELGAAEIEALAAMIQPRTLLVSTTHEPGDAAGAPRDRRALEDDLLQVARRAFTLRWGRGTARRDDAAELWRFVQRLRIPRVELATDGTAFADRALSDRVVDCGVQRIVVWFPTSDPALHEQLTGKKASLAAAVAGVSHLVERAGDAVTAEVSLQQPTLASLDPTVGFAVSLGVDRVVLDYAPSEDAPGPTPPAIAAALGPAAALLQERAVPFTVRGLPYCAAPALADAIADIRHPFDEQLDGRGRLVNVGKERRRRRVKTTPCQDCAFEPRCEGFWKVDVAGGSWGGSP